METYIETYRDAWGIPHLRASSVLELARAQGRVTALDRAWQLEVERHRSQGTSASFLGAGALSWDVLARRARLDDTARRCFAALERRDPETAGWVRAYVDGVNEGLPAGARRAPEFARTGLTPAPWHPWTPLGVWLATHILFAGFPAKLWREQAIRHLGPEAVGLFATDGPGTAGSNGWLVSGGRTATGQALIAGDPHRFIEEPGVYQQIRLSCPEFDVVGLAVPGVPGIAHFGHTGTAAWAITNAMADYQDLYRERLRRTGAGVQALGPDGRWHRAARHTEIVEIAGEPPIEIELIETERGPVIAGGPEGLDAETTPSAPPSTDTEHEPLGPLTRATDGEDGPQGRLAGAADPRAPLARAGDPRAVGGEDGSLGPLAGAAAPLVADGEDGPQRPLARAADPRAPLARAGDPQAAGGENVPQGPPAGAAAPQAVDAEDEPLGLLAGATDPCARLRRVGDPQAAGGENAPQGPPAVDDESGTGGAGGNPMPLQGEAEAFALRYPPRVTEDLGFSALLPLLRARTVQDVDRALDAWTEPVNVVQAADTQGGLLHRVAGRVPLRAKANRLHPVPAWQPGHDWQGWHEMPYAPVDGTAVMANQRGLATPLGVEFAAPHRAARIRALLDAHPTWTADGMPAIHTDTHLASAAPLLDHLAALDGLTPEAARLRDRLLAWNRRMDADSTDAAAYAAVRGAVVRRLAAQPVLAPLTAPPAYPEVLQPWLALVPRIGLALEHLLRAEELYGIDRPATVRAALEEVAAEPPAGTWSDSHRLTPWRALPEPEGEREPGLAGDHDCVLCTSAVPGLTDRAARGPAARYVWDLADRQNSRWVVPLGADGVPGAPHHRDQLPLWLRGELAPIVTDWTLLTREHPEHPEHAERPEETRDR
ncbi:penicillin acylase family protein [Streptomyces fodineus]|uniref:penicillin acylase family protein n=1 Tax=Streptomyces fodineus TaxID=1904616 RepID=UPI000AC99749|nr:penicillin acylase family protein [Streptomyces fodineus]